MLENIEIQRPSVKKMVSITKLLKILLDMANINLVELFKGEKFNIFESLYKITNIILEDYDLDKNDFGKVGKQFFKILSDVTDIDQDKLENFGFDDLHELIVKVSVKLKEVKFISFFMKQVTIFQNTTKE